jgi:hypothetical protein
MVATRSNQNPIRERHDGNDEEDLDKGNQRTRHEGHDAGEEDRVTMTMELQSRLQWGRVQLNAESWNWNGVRAENSCFNGAAFN